MRIQTSTTELSAPIPPFFGRLVQAVQRATRLLTDLELIGRSGAYQAHQLRSDLQFAIDAANGEDLDTILQAIRLLEAHDDA